MLQVDSREPEQIFKKLKKEGIEYQKLELPIGDFVLGDKGICIERKEVGDLIMSIRSGHLQKQLLQMEQNYPNNFLLISGDVKSLFWRKIPITVNQWVGTLSSLVVRYNVKMAQITNDQQLILMVKAICDKVSDGKKVSIRDTSLLKTQLSKDDVLIRLLMGFPNIGLKRAEKLLKDKNKKEILDFFYSYIKTYML